MKYDDSEFKLVSMKEFKTYQKAELFRCRVKNLSEILGSYQNDLKQGLIASGLGLLVSGAGLISQSNFMGFGGLGLTIVAGFISYIDFKKIKKYNSRLQRSRTYLTILENSKEYQSLENKL